MKKIIALLALIVSVNVASAALTASITLTNIQTGNLRITDEIVNATGLPVKFVKVYHNGIAYAMPIYSIQETTS